MVDDQIREQLDSIVSAIGFGIVSDFRDVRDSMYGFSLELQETNRLLDEVNDNSAATNRNLNEFERGLYRQRDSRRFKQLEAQLERRSRLAGQRGDDSMKRVANAIERMQRQMMMSGGNSSQPSAVEEAVDTAAAVGGAVAGGAVAGGAVAGGAAGSFLKGAGKVLSRAGVVGAGVAAGVGIAYMMSGDAEAADLSPQTGPSSSGEVPPVASDISQMGVASALAGATAVAGAKPVVDMVSKTARRKALAKVAPRVPTYLSKFGSKIATTIGLKSIPVFGALVGGYFAFNRFMSGDSWTTIGAEFVSGVAPDIGALGGPAGYVAGVASTLAIQTYLISRDIYTEENAVDIRNGVVPNFDDLEMSERTQVVKDVGAYVEAYVNNLIGRSKTEDSDLGKITPSTSGAGGTSTPPNLSLASNPVQITPASDSSAPAMTPQSSPGITTSTAQQAGERVRQEENAAGDAQTSFMQGLAAESPAASAASAPDLSMDSGAASPSDTVATVQTRSDQTSMYSGAGTLESLKEEIAKGEGDYGAYNRGVAGDTPRSSRSVDLQSLTVGQVMDLQAQGKIFAAGKYQFIPGTLREAVQYTGIDLNQKFDASTQEQLFPYLISDAKRPTLAGYLSGRHEDADAALNDLAAEFASIPQSNGRGRYDGDRAGNKAAGGLQRAEKIKGMLKSIRESNVSVRTEDREEIVPAAEGAVITPLPSDKQKPGRDLSMELRPPNTDFQDADEESNSASMGGAMDYRSKRTPSGNPKEKIKNQISTYAPLMMHMFGSMTDEFKSHISGEVTAEKAFKDAMNPIG